MTKEDGSDPDNQKEDEVTESPGTESEKDNLSEEQRKAMAKKIRTKLVVDKAAVYDDLIEMASKYIGIEENGTINIKNPENLKGIELVALVLIGKKLAFMGGLCSTDVASLSEISNATGQAQNVANARLTQLRREGVVELPARGEYRIGSPARARRILLSIGGKKETE